MSCRNFKCITVTAVGISAFSLSMHAWPENQKLRASFSLSLIALIAPWDVSGFKKCSNLCNNASSSSLQAKDDASILLSLHSGGYQPLGASCSPLYLAQKETISLCTCKCMHFSGSKMTVLSLHGALVLGRAYVCHFADWWSIWIGLCQFMHMQSLMHSLASGIASKMYFLLV